MKNCGRITVHLNNGLSCSKKRKRRKASFYPAGTTGRHCCRYLLFLKALSTTGSRPSSGTADQQTLKKCDAVIEYCFFCSYTKHTGTFTSLYGYINRYEQHDLALIEHIDGQTLDAIETAMDEYFCYVEALTGLKRLPKPNQSTTGLVGRIGGLVKDCHG